MEYLTQNELKRMILLSCEKIEKEKEAINKINVFPVPDQDTGNNLAKTLAGIRGAIENKDFNDLSEISEVILDAALTFSQGNAGVIYTGFLAGFFSQADKNPLDAKKLSLAFEKGSERARQSILNPKEGTILDVIDAASLAIKQKVDNEKNIINLFEASIKDANEALLATREKMEIFKKANVVDAGGMGFLMILESYLEALEKEKKSSFGEDEGNRQKASEQIGRFIQVISNRYEIVSLLENLTVDEDGLRNKLKDFGNSLDMVQVGDKIKIHIHTDFPDEVKKIIKESGQIIELRTEDMAKEVVGEESVRKVSIGIVTEEAAMLLPKIIERYQIAIVNLGYDWPHEKDLPGENIYQKMREAENRGIKDFPKTSQATPGSYLAAFKNQLKIFEKVICITLTSRLSGCYNSAVQARELLAEEEKERVFILDSLNGAAGQALIILELIELIQEGKQIEEVISDIKKIIPEVHFYLALQDPKWLEAIGRIDKSKADWARRMKKLKLHPLMEIKNGVVKKDGIIFAKDEVEALLNKTIKDSAEVIKQGRNIRVVIGHADSLEDAQKLKKMLKEKIKAEVSFINLGPAVICVAVGPGSLFIGWSPI